MKKERPTTTSHRKTKLSEFAKRLLSEWQELDLPQAGVVLVAVSGGADSTALLLALEELKRSSKLSLNIVVIHLDHRLRKASSEDADWVKALSCKLGYSAVIGAADIRRRAKDTADNLEQTARRSRYEFFRKTAAQQQSSLLVTAHTLDDQAETVLMRLLRGSAAEGLSGIESVRPLFPGSATMLARPLLSWARRSDTEHYCRARRVRFRSDEMNDDERFVRVKVRKQLLPLMQTFNGKIVEALARTANLLREDAAALTEAAERVLEQAKNGPIPGAETAATPLKISVLAAAPPSIRRRALRQWIYKGVGHLRRIEMVHLLAVEGLLEGTRGRGVELPNGTKVTRKRGWLYLSVKKVEKPGRNL